MSTTSSGASSSPPSSGRGPWLAVWLSILALFSLVVGTAGGMLQWVSTHVVTEAILMGGGTFAGTATLGLIVLGLIYTVI